MVKSQNRTISVIAILLMLGASPLSVNYSFADIEDTQESRLGAILTEKIVDGKLVVQHYSLPDDYTEGDTQRMLSLDHTSGWAYVNYKAYHSGIILFDGKASKVGENLWEISTNDISNLGERQVDSELSKKSSDSRLVKHKNSSNNDLSYKIIFSGKVVDEIKESVYVISFMNSSFKNPEMSQIVKFQQIGEMVINSEKLIGSNQEFRN